MRIITLILLCFAALHASAQKQGFVFDSKTKRPVTDVKVSFPGSFFQEATDSLGRFGIYFSLWKDEDTISFSHIGYTPVSFTYKEIKDKNYKIYLKALTQVLPEVEITAAEKKLYLDCRELASMPQGVYGFGAALLDGKIYVIGGDETITGQLSNSRYSSHMQIYDLEKDEWIVSPHKFRRRAYHTMSACHDNLLVIGGKYLSTSGTSEYLDNTIEWYNVTKDTVMIDKATPHQAAFLSSFVYDNKVIVLGGVVSINQMGWKKYLDKAHVLDAATGAWYELFEVNKLEVEQGCLTGHFLYLIRSGAQRGPASLLQYDMLTGKWKHVRDLPFDSYGLCVVADENSMYLYKDGQIIVYDFEDNTLKKYNTMLHVKDCKMVCYKGKLYLLGGKNEDEIQCRVDDEDSIDRLVVSPSNKVYSIDIEDFKQTRFIVL